MMNDESSCLLCVFAWELRVCVRQDYLCFLMQRELHCAWIPGTIAFYCECEQRVCVCVGVNGMICLVQLLGDCQPGR